MTDATAVKAATAGPTGAAAGPARKLAGDFDMFVKMLVTQVQNQDPLSPMDAAQYTQQLATYSQVEQAIAANDKLAAILEQMGNQDVRSAAELLGRRVMLDDSTAPVQEGAAEWRFDAPLARPARWIVTTPEGQAIGEGRIEAGERGVRLAAPAGAASLSLALLKPDGDEKLAVIPRGIGRVTAVERSDEGVAVEVGPQSIALGKVRGVL